MAALEAWRQAGGKDAIRYLHDIWVEMINVLDASAEDDLRDDDSDGVPDVSAVYIYIYARN